MDEEYCKRRKLAINDALRNQHTEILRALSPTSKLSPRSKSQVGFHVSMGVLNLTTALLFSADHCV